MVSDPPLFTRGSNPQPQSSSLTLPCQILVSVDGCRSLTAYGGCAHWARASSRRPAPRTARRRRAGRSGDMRLGRGFTAARRQASRLAGLAGRCPAPNTAPQGAGLLERHAAWPGFYRRSATGLAARRSGAAPCQLSSIDRHSATGLMAR